MDPNRVEAGKRESRELEALQDRDSTAGRRSAASFDAFYEFSFPRVYGFAQRHTETEPEAEALCRLILTRALTSFGGLDAWVHPVHRVSAETSGAPAASAGRDAAPPAPPSPSPSNSTLAPTTSITLTADAAQRLYSVARDTLARVVADPALLRHAQSRRETVLRVRPTSSLRARVPSR